MGGKLGLSASLALVIVFGLATLPGSAQTAPAAPPAAQQEAQPSKGKVIFSRSTDENGQTTDQASPPSEPAIAADAKPSVGDAERQAGTFTSYGLDVHLRPAEQQIAVRALLSIRNDGPSPLSTIPLQLSSSLHWERIRADGKEIAFQVATLNSDADHTGQMHEAAVRLTQPLAPGQSLQLDVSYSGLIAPSAQRLFSIGAPEQTALRSDWDQISPGFTGLRGFGNVLWYPVSSVPVLLGDGARLFDEMSKQKLRLTGARFRLRLTVEFPHGQAPTVAVINGHSVPLTITEAGASLDQSQEVAGVATADSDSATLGFEAPSLFVATRTAHPGTNLTAWTLPENNLAVQFWTTAATAVTPFLQSWLGKQPRSQLVLLDLPDPQDAPFEAGSLLAAPLCEPDPKAPSEALNGILVHALSHAWATAPNLPPPPAWLNEGLATFMSSLWIEKRNGREAALSTLEANRGALALAEPESPGQSSGQPLAQAISPVYYRTKAAYVLWMLRDLAGDQSLSAALRAYDPVVHNSLEKLIEDATTRPDLGWFFGDWVDADKGLPDLKINGIFPTSASVGYWLVAIHIANAGYAAAEVPVTVRSGSGADAASATQRVRIPARAETVSRILIQGKPVSVQVNDGDVPETQTSVHITRLDEPAEAPPGSSQSNPPTH
ncbi:MAG: hypothetical protein WB424_15325 [Terracidiphilus sp.]